MLRTSAALLYVLQVNCMAERRLLFTELGTHTPASSQTEYPDSRLMGIDSALHCAQVCGLKEDCNSISYDQSTNACHLYTADIMEPPNDTGASSRHYRVTEREPNIWVMNCTDDLLDDVTDERITSSSDTTVRLTAERARLSSVHEGLHAAQGAWCAGVSDLNQYIQIFTGNTDKDHLGTTPTGMFHSIFSRQVCPYKPLRVGNVCLYEVRCYWV
ncbi:hypothetical protein ScPMuIL_016738 [Solemya velum]